MYKCHPPHVKRRETGISPQKPEQVCIGRKTTIGLPGESDSGGALPRDNNSLPRAIGMERSRGTSCVKSVQVSYSLAINDAKDIRPTAKRHPSATKPTSIRSDLCRQRHRKIGTQQKVSKRELKLESQRYTYAKARKPLEYLSMVCSPWLQWDRNQAAQLESRLL